MQKNKVNNKTLIDPWDALSSSDDEELEAPSDSDIDEEQVYIPNFDAETGTLYTSSFEMLNSPLVKKIEFQDYFNLPLNNLKFYPNLEEIWLDQDFKQDFDGLESCLKLHTITLSRGYKVEEHLDQLKYCKSLRTLNISHSMDIKGLLHVIQLENLSMDDLCLANIMYLKNMKNFKKLKVFGNCGENDEIKKLALRHNKTINIVHVDKCTEFHFTSAE